MRIVQNTRVALIALSCTLVLFGCSYSGPVEFSETNGRVVDDHGDAISGATVTVTYECKQPNPVDSATTTQLETISTTSGIDGGFQFASIQKDVNNTVEGSCTKKVHVTKPGYCVREEYCRTSMYPPLEEAKFIVEEVNYYFGAIASQGAHDGSEITIKLIALPEYLAVIKALAEPPKQEHEDPFLLASEPEIHWAKETTQRMFFQISSENVRPASVVLYPASETRQRGACVVELEIEQYAAFKKLLVLRANVRVHTVPSTVPVNNVYQLVPDPEMLTCFLAGDYDAYLRLADGREKRDIDLSLRVHITD